MENNNLNWEMVPEGWALCFNQNCPLHEACLRYQAGLLAPQSLTGWAVGSAELDYRTMRYTTCGDG